jgi:hypothetical protein
MNEPAGNRWIGKSAEDVLMESYHEIREPINITAGYLNVLKSANRLSLTTEQAQQYIESAFNYILQAKKIVDSVYQYMNEKRRDQ